MLAIITVEFGRAPADVKVAHLSNLRLAALLVVDNNTGLISEVNQRRARLVLQMVTVCGRLNYLRLM